MYADGSAKSLANLLHAVGPVVGDSNKYDQVLNSFVDLARGTVDVAIYVTAVDDYLATVSGESLKTIEFALKTSRNRLAEIVIERHSGLHQACRLSFNGRWSGCLSGQEYRNAE
jgi:hypothetical protein